MFFLMIERIVDLSINLPNSFCAKVSKVKFCD